MLLIKRLFMTGIVAGLLMGACAPERAGAPQGLVEEAHEFEMGAATMPVYVITAAGAPAEAAQILADILDLPASPLEEDGALRYLDVERFQSIPVVPLGQGEPDEEGAPTILEAIDFEALYALSVLEDQDAVDRADEALQAAGLAEFGGVEGLEFTAAVDHSRLEGENLERTAQIDIPLDTQVIYDFTLDGIPLVGPGAKVKLVFDGQGAVTQLYYAMRGLARAEEIQIVPPEGGDELCAQAYRGEGDLDPGLKLEVWSKLVYYAPPPWLTRAERIYPHYMCGGMATLSEPQNEEITQFSLMTTFVPAFAERPRASLSLDVDGGWVRAQVEVSGGTAPYRYSWSSSSTSLDLEASLSGPGIEYAINAREPVGSETLSVLVTDANGLTAAAENSAAVAAGVVRRSSGHVEAIPDRVSGPIDVGAEYVGRLARPPLSTSSTITGGFLRNFSQKGFVVRFHWGEEMAWERDFRKRWSMIDGNSGTDEIWADNVDLMFFAGHGAPAGISFGVNQDERWMMYTEAAWGDQDMEWIVLNACETLGGTQQAAIARWGWDAWLGYHVQMGYSTTAADASDVGWRFSEYLLRTPPLQPMKVRQAWAVAATEAQPAWIYSRWEGKDVRIHYAYIIPYTYAGYSNWNDYFHNYGTVTKDISASEVHGFYRITGPT